MTTTKLFTIPQAADQLGVSPNHVYRLIAAGALRSVDMRQPKSRKAKTRVRADDLAAFIDKQTRTKLRAVSGAGTA